MHTSAADRHIHSRPKPGAGVDELLADIRAMGFPSFLYCVNQSSAAQAESPPAPRHVVTSGISDDFTARWERTEHRRDPLRRLFSRGLLKHDKTLPFVWENRNGRIDGIDAPLSVTEQAFLRYCYSQGIHTAVNVPIYDSRGSFSIVSFYSDLPVGRLRIGDSMIERLFLRSHQLHAELSALAPAMSNKSNQTRLSPREIECMQWAARGKNSTEIAKILGLSVLTVRDHFRNAAGKLNAVSRTQALSILFTQGLLEN